MANTRRVYYTPRQLQVAYLKDLVIDIRCAARDSQWSYRAECVAEFRRLWAKRHAKPRIGTFGVPK